MDLALIPRSLRDKLDRAGVKLHLKEWELFTLAERQRLVDHPCESTGEIDTMRADLTEMIRRYTGREPDRVLR